MSCEQAWIRVHKHQGEIFKTTSGLPYDYSVDGNGIRISGEGRLINRRITRNQINRAIERCPLQQTTDIRDCIGMSYIFGILMDPRVRRGLW